MSGYHVLFPSRCLYCRLPFQRPKLFALQGERSVESQYTTSSTARMATVPQATTHGIAWHRGGCMCVHGKEGTGRPCITHSPLATERAEVTEEHSFPSQASTPHDLQESLNTASQMATPGLDSCT